MPVCLSDFDLQFEIKLFGLSLSSPHLNVVLLDDSHVLYVAKVERTGKRKCVTRRVPSTKTHLELASSSYVLQRLLNLLLESSLNNLIGSGRAGSRGHVYATSLPT